MAQRSIGTAGTTFTSTLSGRSSGPQAGAATFGGAGSLSALPSQRQNAVFQAGGLGTLSIFLTKYISATFSGSGAFSASYLFTGVADPTFQSSAFQNDSFQVDLASNLLEVHFAGAGTLAVYPNVYEIAAVFNQGSGMLAVGTIAADAGAEFLSGAGGLSVDATKPGIQFASATFNGASTLYASSPAPGAAIPAFQADSFQNDSFQVVAVTPSSAATLNGLGSLSAIAGQQQVASALFVGSGILSSDTVRAGQQQAAATFAGASALSIAARQGMMAFTNLSGAGNFSIATPQEMDSAAILDSGTGTLSVFGNLNARTTARFGRFPQILGDSITSITGNLIEAAAAEFDGAGRLSVEATITGAINAWSGQATFGGTGTLSAYPVFSPALISAIFRTPPFFNSSMVVDASQPKSSAATFSGAGALSTDTSQFKVISATFNGASGLSVNLTRFGQLAVTFNGAGQLVADSSHIKVASAVFGGTGSLSGVFVAPLNQIDARFAGASTLAVSTQAGYAGSVRLTGTGVMLVSVAQNAVISARFGGAGTQSAFAVITGAAVAWDGQARFAGAGALNAFAYTPSAQFIDVRIVGQGNLTVDALQISKVIPFPEYTYPIGHSLSSDYGIRAAKLRRGRLVIGRR